MEMMILVPGLDSHDCLSISICIEGVLRTCGRMSLFVLSQCSSYYRSSIIEVVSSEMGRPRYKWSAQESMIKGRICVGKPSLLTCSSFSHFDFF